MSLHDTQLQFAGYIRNPDVAEIPAAIEPRRMAIYRELFFNNIEGTLSRAFPVIKAILQEQHWLSMVRHFMVSYRCKTPLFHEVAQEFLDYLSQQRNEKHDPLFLKELAHYEWVELALSISTAEFSVDTFEEDVLAHRFSRSPLAWVLRYNFPVHTLSEENQPESAGEVPTFLMAYRNGDYEVKFIELNPVSARLLDFLQDGSNVFDAASQIAKELNHPNPDQVISAAATMVKDWQQKGILHRSD